MKSKILNILIVIIISILSRYINLYMYVIFITTLSFMYILYNYIQNRFKKNEWDIITEKVSKEDRYFIIVKKKNYNYYRYIGSHNGYKTIKDAKQSLKRLKRITK